MQEGNTGEQQTASLQELDAHHGGERTAAATKTRQRASAAWERAALVKKRELAAHARAIELHEQAAALQDRLGHPARAARAREHAAHARALLEEGRAEQQRQEEHNKRREREG